MAFIEVNGGELIHTSNLIIFAENDPMYKYEANIDKSEVAAIIEVEVFFLIDKELITTNPVKLRGIIDTGTTQTVISKRVVPNKVIKSIAGSKKAANTLGGPVYVYRTSNILIEFPDQSTGRNYPVTLDTALVINDKKNYNSKIKAGRTPFDIYIGMDIINKGLLIINEPQGKFKLKLGTYNYFFPPTTIETVLSSNE